MEMMQSEHLEQKTNLTFCNKMYTYRVTTKKYEEAELVKMLKKRKEAAFDYLYKNYNDNLLLVIMEIIPDDEIAADILQEVFIKIHRNIASYDHNKSRLYSWMVRIAHNLAIDTVRGKDYRNHQRNDSLMLASDLTSTFSTKVDYIGLRSQFCKIRPIYWEVVELNYYKGYTHEEIASLLKLPIGTVKTRIRAGLIELRTMTEKITW